MALRAFAGRFAPRSREGVPGRPALEASLVRDGPATGIEDGALALAWTPSSPPPRTGAPALCLIDGRPRTGALAEELRLDPSAPPELLVAAGYDRLGDGVLDWIQGEFALLVWDGRRRRGLLARDRLGLRPLFVAPAPGGILFGSEIRNLLALLPHSPAPDAVAMAHWLTRSPLLDSRTLYAGIERLPAAHAIELGRDGWRRRRYWKPSYAEPRTVAAEDAAEEVRAALGRAVERSLDGAARPAVLLSGGLDSSAVAAMSGTRVRAYSAVFPDDEEIDESAGIARVREAVGAGGVEASFRAGSALAAGAEFIRAWEVPSVSPNVFLWLPLLRRAAADGVDVMLDGEGGDELFGCAYYLVADRLREGRPLAALRTARRLPGMGDRPRARWLGRAMATYGVRAALPYGLHERLRSARGRRGERPAWLGDELERIHRVHDDPWAWKRSAAPRWWAHLAHTLTVTGDAIGAPDQMRRTGRLAGVERRHPLRDPDLVDLVLRLPPELAFHPRLDRPLLRRALAGELPEDRLQENRKPVFNSLLIAALAGRDASALRALLSDPDPELARRLRMDAVRTMLSKPAREQPRRWALDLWRIAALEMWLEHRSDPEAALRRTSPPAGEAEISFMEVPVPARQISARPRPRGSVPT